MAERRLWNLRLGRRPLPRHNLEDTAESIHLQGADCKVEQSLSLVSTASVQQSFWWHFMDWRANLVQDDAPLSNGLTRYECSTVGVLGSCPSLHSQQWWAQASKRSANLHLFS